MIYYFINQFVLILLSPSLSFSLPLLLFLSILSFSLLFLLLSFSFSLSCQQLSQVLLRIHTLHTLEHHKTCREVECRHATELIQMRVNAG